MGRHEQDSEERAEVDDDDDDGWMEEEGEVGQRCFALAYHPWIMISA